MTRGYLGSTPDGGIDDHDEDAPFNEYAFPSHGSMGEVAHEGMTLRDYFAGQAIAECLRVAADQTPQQRDADMRLSVLFGKAGIYAYAMADSLLKARQA